MHVKQKINITWEPKAIRTETQLLMPRELTGYNGGTQRRNFGLGIVE